MMKRFFTNVIGPNLAYPSKSFGGWIVKKVIFEKKNLHLVKNAVKHLEIEPHHKVLEIGFGPGFGLEAAYHCIKDGNGAVYGCELSSYMIEVAAKKLRRQCLEGKVHLILANVINLPYETDYFDRVFHVNCYYFWSNRIQALKELRRVLKPGAPMVTTLDLDSLKDGARKGAFKSGGYQFDPLDYMSDLEVCGFENIRIEYFDDGGKNYQAIFATNTADENVDVHADEASATG